MSESTPPERATSQHTPHNGPAADSATRSHLGIDAEEVQGSLEVRRALGSEAEAEVIRDFLARTSLAIDERVDQRIAENSPPSSEGSTDSGGFWLAAASIGAGVPITGVATSFSDSGSVVVAVVAWAGIALVNAAYNFRRNR